MNKPKLIIHETDCHGCGVVCFNGTVKGYSYDDGEMGDVKTTIIHLIKLGFINPDDVVIYENDEIYNIVEKYVNGE